MVLFSDTTTSGLNVEIQTAFFGSIGGVCNVAGGLTIGPGGCVQRGATHRLVVDYGKCARAGERQWQRGARRSEHPCGSAVFDPPAVAVLSANPDWFIAYLGLNDAKTALTGANPNFTLSFNGTGLTNSGGVFSDLSPVEKGKYTFWGYEHFLYLPALTGDQLNVAQLIETEILTSTAPVSGVLVADMTVHRDSDGGKN